MLDDLQRLSEAPRLLELLAHYAERGKPDRQVWQDRVMQIEGVEPRELSRLHGELIAFGWIEQHTGQCSAAHEPLGARCYRVTLQGLRDLSHVRGVEFKEEPAEPAEKRRPKLPRKKKDLSPPAPEGAAIAPGEPGCDAA